jgi:hypothetical protein
MDSGSIFLIVALVLLVILFIGRPLFFPSTKPPSPRGNSDRMIEREHSALLAKRDGVINALQELDFDNALGKIPEKDYPSRREALLLVGAQALRQLDQTGSPQTVEKTAPLPVTQEDDDLEILISTRRRSRLEKAAGFCPQCGNPVQKSDKFCYHCGRTQ